jgi:SAM-dependent methyltransferase
VGRARRSRREFAGRGNLCFENQNIEHLPYENGTFDEVFGSSMLPPATPTLLHRLVCPMGALVDILPLARGNAGSLHIVSRRRGNVSTGNRDNWAAKPALREYYTREVYDPIFAELVPGTTLEIGSGALLLAEHFARRMPNRKLVTTDLTDQPGLDFGGVDCHDLPFEGGRYGNVICLHVLHHLACPAAAMREMARVLRPGGRLVFVEPWTRGAGRLFYKYLHHEGFETLDDPWSYQADGDKAVMDANVALARLLLEDHGGELTRHVPELTILRKRFFAGGSYLATGGFRRSRGAPAWAVRLLCNIEHRIPQAMMRKVCLQCQYVLEKRSAKANS